MKKFLLIAMLLLVSSNLLQAQNDVTKFLGIPVDGTKSEMTRQLIEKGFRLVPNGDGRLKGEFNGYDVELSVVTNNNKVYRIYIADKNRVSESDIKIRFNRLCEQFKNNPNYYEPLGEYSIPDDENISYEMTVNKKRYQASFYQRMDEDMATNEVYDIIKTKYTEEQLEHPSTEIGLDIMKISMDYHLQRRFNKSVWFMISEIGGKYYISMYYDNVYNQANGEDL